MLYAGASQTAESGSCEVRREAAVSVLESRSFCVVESRAGRDGGEGSEAPRARAASRSFSIVSQSWRMSQCMVIGAIRE